MLSSSRRRETEYVERTSKNAEIRLWFPGMHCKPRAQWVNGRPNEGVIYIIKQKKTHNMTYLKDALVPSQSVIEGCQGECHW